MKRYLKTLTEIETIIGGDIPSLRSFNESPSKLNFLATVFKVSNPLDIKGVDILIEDAHGYISVADIYEEYEKSDLFFAIYVEEVPNVL